MGTTDRIRLVIVAILLIAGCGPPASSEPLSSPAITCTGVPQAKCDEAVAGAARSLPNTPIATIEVLCVAESCTEEMGAMDTIVHTADGSTLRSPTNAWSTPGGGESPAPAPTEAAVPWRPQCQGVPAEACELMAETSFGELSTEGVEKVVVRCGVLAPCTRDRGVGETVVTYVDGSTDSAAWEYDFD